MCSVCDVACVTWHVCGVSCQWWGACCVACAECHVFVVYCMHVVCLLSVLCCCAEVC